jgi:hypothetical protein
VEISRVKEIGYPISPYINTPLGPFIKPSLSLSLSLSMRCSLQRRRRTMPMRMRGRKKRLRLPLVENTKAVKLTTIQRKLRQLQRIIPSSHEMEPETLFPRIAIYILLLEVKVTILKNLSILYGV